MLSFMLILSMCNVDNNMLTFLTGVCYGLEGICDGISDCPEYDHEHYTCSTCQSTAYKCPNSNRCITEVKKCDGFTDCYDGADEKGIS